MTARSISQGLFPPDGFVYRADLISPDEQDELVRHIRTLDLREFEFHGYFGKRRVISFGWHYKFDTESLVASEQIPPFLDPLRERAAAFAGLEARDLVHALITEYSPGTPIGWHRDKAVFGEVIGISLVSPCTFRLRRRISERKWERYSLTLSPLSAYILSGESRTDWEHSIPEVDALRYSVTFRTLRR